MQSFQLNILPLCYLIYFVVVDMYFINYIIFIVSLA